MSEAEDVAYIGGREGQNEDSGPNLWEVRHAPQGGIMSLIQGLPVYHCSPGFPRVIRDYSEVLTDCGPGPGAGAIVSSYESTR